MTCDYERFWRGLRPRWRRPARAWLALWAALAGGCVLRVTVDDLVADAACTDAACDDEVCTGAGCVDEVDAVWLPVLAHLQLRLLTPRPSADAR